LHAAWLEKEFPNTDELVTVTGKMLKLVRVGFAVEILLEGLNARSATNICARGRPKNIVAEADFEN
jgi:hypothetical protein